MKYIKLISYKFKNIIFKNFYEIMNNLIADNFK